MKAFIEAGAAGVHFEDQLASEKKCGHLGGKVLVQVKGGDMLNPGMVRDLIGTVKKEGAAIGLLITLKKPSAGMLADAVHSEPYYSELWDKKYRKTG